MIHMRKPQRLRYSVPQLYGDNGKLSGLSCASSCVIVPISVPISVCPNLGPHHDQDSAVARSIPFYGATSGEDPHAVPPSVGSNQRVSNSATLRGETAGIPGHHFGWVRDSSAKLEFVLRKFVVRWKILCLPNHLKISLEFPCNYCEFIGACTLTKCAFPRLRGLLQP